MNQPQRKLSETLTFTTPAADRLVEATDESHAMATSPARALQAKLSVQLESTPLLKDRHAMLKMVGTFTAACAGTWIFGALLYLQV